MSVKKFFLVMLIVLVGFSVFAGDSSAWSHSSPEWTWNEDCEDFDNHYFYAVGSAKYKNVSNSTKAAKLRAKAELARQLGERINAFTDDFSEESGESEDTQEIKAFRDYSSSLVKDQKLAGVKQVDMWKDTDGTVFVLVRVEKTVIEKEVRSLIADQTKSFKKNAASIAAEESRENLIDKYFGIDCIDLSDESEEF